MTAAVPIRAEQTPLPDKVWVIIRPIQCLGNPWEKEWIAKHPRKPIKELQQKEFEILRDYLAAKKLKVLDLRYKRYAGQAIGKTCDSSRGDAIYVLTPATEIAGFVDLGYTERMAASDPAPKK